MRGEIGDVMNKLKKAAAVAVMVGGLGLVGGGVASASGGDYDDPFGSAVDNLQIVECEQSFDGGTAFAAAPIGDVGGGVEQSIGNFCSASNIED
ncbi:hypothetical protein [Streptomyces turgidiscabies]|uniref:Secreted protein n=1 Tax=Streptomyces turgidiscabies TaxID=85558 RepID=A0ABU0RFB0_9ACTN|nr:hypothetical protein [Streptomyces turgidiscabies]MDQ0930679.1 hypothetical protein [Streptomyces turgidiscabies]